MSVKTQPLTNLQLELLKLFSRNVSENELLEIKKIIARYFAEKVMNEVDKAWSQKGLTEIDAEALAHQHLRVPYNNESR